jgi:uncharacterized protein
VKRACFIFILAWCATAGAKEVIPPKPVQYFNDYARVVPPGIASGLNQTLRDFETRTSNQVLVVVYPKMQSDSSVEDYTVRVAQSWGVGRKGRNNGAVLFVFIEDRQMFIDTGYGLEGALPDALCKQIIEDEIKPRFRNGDYAGGLTAGINAIISATKGEYKGSRSVRVGPYIPIGIAVLIILIALISQIRRQSQYAGRYGHSGGWSWGGPFIGGSLGGGGSWSGGGGGGFSAGGGSFGGGGAGGRW